MRPLALLLPILALTFLAPNAARAQGWPDALGPFTVGDDVASLRLSGIAQLQLQTEAPGETALRIRRLRPILRPSLADGRVQGTVHLELVPGGMELIDLFVDASLVPGLRVRVGQFKVPYTEYWQQSLIDLANVDWPLTSRWFGGERQLGVMAHGELDAFGYAVGAFAGENRRGAYARELPRVYGESHGNPSSLTVPRPPEPLHLELVGRAVHSADGMDTSTVMDVSGGPLRHAVALSVAWDTDPTHRRDYALRVAPELWLKAFGVSFVGVVHLGLFEDAAGAARPAGVGVLGELGWHAHRHVELSLRFARVDLFDALRADASDWAAALEPSDLGAREAWEAQYGDVGSLRATQELTFGVNVLIIGRSLSWMNDVAWMRTERSDGARDALRLRSQLTLAF